MTFALRFAAVIFGFSLIAPCGTIAHPRSDRHLQVSHLAPRSSEGTITRVSPNCQVCKVEAMVIDGVGPQWSMSNTCLESPLAERLIVGRTVRYGVILPAKDNLGHIQTVALLLPPAAKTDADFQVAEGKICLPRWLPDGSPAKPTFVSLAVSGDLASGPERGLWEELFGSNGDLIETIEISYQPGVAEVEIIGSKAFAVTNATISLSATQLAQITLTTPGGKTVALSTCSKTIDSINSRTNYSCNGK